MFRSWCSVAVAIATVCVAASCDNGPDRSATAFCNELDAQVPFLEGPSALTQEGIDEFVARYDRLNEMTPLAIEDEWQQLTDLVHTAATAVPTDPESVQRTADAAYAAERSTRDVANWAATTCGVTMPAVLGIEDPAALTTTIAPETSAP
jgi:hypothetical protein